MARFYAGGRSSAASTSVRGPGLYAGANDKLKLVEVGIFNTTTTAFAAQLTRATAAGTPTGQITNVLKGDPDTSVNGAAYTGHSADATVLGSGPQASIGAAIGSGTIWTFGDSGLIIPKGTANGAVIILPTGTGQIFDFYFVWDE